MHQSLDCADNPNNIFPTIYTPPVKGRQEERKEEDSNDDEDEEEVSCDDDDEIDEDYASAADEDAVEASKDNDAVDQATNAVVITNDLNVSNITETCSESVGSSSSSNSRFEGLDGVLRRENVINKSFVYHDILKVRGSGEIKAFSPIHVKGYMRHFLFVGVIVQSERVMNRNLVFDRIGQLHHCCPSYISRVPERKEVVTLPEEISNAEKALTLLLSRLKKLSQFPKDGLAELPRDYRATTAGDCDAREELGKNFF